MKKVSLCTLAAILLLASCKKPLTNDSMTLPPSGTDDVQAITQRSCAANEVLQEQLKADPELAQRMNAIETFTQRAIRTGITARVTQEAVVTIPVVVHVLYNNNAQNISDGQINSQIAVLNEDYQRTNADASMVPASFTSVASTGMKVQFVLSQIIRKQTKVKSWSANDAMKYSNRSGDDAVNPAKNLNIWVCNLGSGLLGYAQFPGGKAATDGVVILYSAFGSKSKYAAGTYIAKYDEGRSATHEVGHWLNLYHIWGDDGSGCSGTDKVDDTPNQGGANYGCPSPHSSCSNTALGGDMYMNYMDYTDDKCMFMFTEGQKSRMLAVFAAGGPRAALAGN